MEKPSLVVKISNQEDLNQIIEKNKIPNDINIEKLKIMLDRSELLYLVIHGGYVCGYAATQVNGLYRFGYDGEMVVSRMHAMFKNLYVSVNFRKKSFGNFLNIARVVDVTKNRVPLVFVTKDNRYAIKNWLKINFEEVATIKQKVYFSRKKINHIIFNKNIKEHPSLKSLLDEIR
jgi:ribosomal protein S18 acetylase RimI-like enzyme